MGWNTTLDTSKQIRMVLFKGMENKRVLQTSEIHEI